MSYSLDREYPELSCEHETRTRVLEDSGPDELLTGQGADPEI